MDIQKKLNDLLITSETKDSFNFFKFDTKTKYFIKNVDIFWNLYNTLIKELPFNDHYLAEKPLLYYSYLRFDIDIYSNTPNISRLYDNEFIVKIVTFLFEEIDKLNNDNQEIQQDEKICCIFTKKKWHEKDGLHLIFPYIFCDQNYHIHFYNILQKFIDDNLNNNIESNNTIQKISVDNVFNKTWVLYGSKKSVDSEKYNLTSVYTFSNNIISLISNTSFNEASLYSVNTEVHIKKIFVKNVVVIKPEMFLHYSHDINKDYNKIIGVKMMELLHSSRSDNYDSWIDIGITLFNIGAGDHRFYALFDNFSKQSPKYIDGETLRLWEKVFYKTCKTIGSLIRYVKEDNLEQYIKNTKEYFKECYFIDIKEDDPLHFLLTDKVQISNAFYCMVFGLKYDKNYVYSQKQWYMFNEYIYKEISDRIIGKKIIEIKDDTISLLNDLIVQYADSEESVKNIKKKKIKVLNDIDNSAPLTNIIKYLSITMNNDAFKNLLNTNNKIMLCDNGVMDFNLRVFRTATSDDYSTRSTNNIFPIYSDNNILKETHNLLQIQLFNYLDQLFGDHTNEVLNLLTYTMVNNHSKILIVSMGETNTGKSAWVNLLEKTFGDYACTIAKETIYVRKSDRGKAKPEIVNTKGRKFAFVNETSGKECMAQDEVKMYVSGGADNFPARALYEPGGDMKMSATLWITCNTNELPYISDADDAIWDRIKCIFFKSKFDRYSPKCLEEQKKQQHYPRLESLNSFFESVAGIFLHFLFERLKQINENETLHLPMLDKNTKKLRKNNNYIFKFTFHKLEEKQGEDILTVDLFGFFKNWYKNNFESKQNRIANSYGDIRTFEKEILSSCLYTTIKTEHKTNKFTNMHYIIS